MTYTCPDGHSSEAGDYCDVCGAPIGAATSTPAAAPVPAGSGAASAAGPAASAAAPGSLLDLGGPAAGPGGPGGPAATAGPPATRDCPNCGTDNPPDALFCEDCGYDFTTGQLPRPLDPPAGVPASGSPDTGPLGAGSPDPAAPGAAAPDAGALGTPVPTTGAVTTLPPDVAASGGPVAGGPSAPGPSASGPVTWVVEVWVDPDWYAAQESADPCPSPGMPVVVPLREHSVLVGRTSTSRNIHPQVDLSSDTGVSRWHAQLSTDGQRWWVEDLQSANGTYLGDSGGTMPTTPITPGQKVELGDDERIYVGAWTRLVVRAATDSERGA